MRTTTLIFATNNPGKVLEVQSFLPAIITVKSLNEAGIFIDIPEPYNTLEENARQKSKTIFSLAGINCFGEDTGLEVYALNGQPGVKTARFAGDRATDAENIDKLLTALNGNDSRAARFRTVMSLMFNGKEYQFEGICEGQIALFKTGSNGFGYDPVFMPENARYTFAEMQLHEKNEYSHRKKAMMKLVAFLNNSLGQTED